MSALYSIDILRLAANTVDFPRLTAPHATVERRSKTCGSVIVADVRLGDDGRVEACGYQLYACAVGQAAATIMGRAAIGRSPEEIVTLAQQLRAFLMGERDAPPAIEGIDALVPVRAYRARHGAALLAFDATAAAAAAPATA